MVRLASGDRPAFLCLQELPVWSLSRLEAWSGMTTVADVTKRPHLGPFRSSAELGRVITDLNHGLFRSAFTGQANAILLGTGLRLLEHRHLVLNSFRFRRAEGRRLGLDPAARRAWGRERRVCQVLRVASEDTTFVVANLHATGSSDKRLPDAELLRGAAFADGLTEPGELCVFAGDFNVKRDESWTLRELVKSEWGFSKPGPGIDHVLVRGAPSSPERRWPESRRRRGPLLLSDHAPVEVEIE
jgi:endonuclease/exonuclease/phosphatase family metal-dependent hydrolase